MVQMTEMSIKLTVKPLLNTTRFVYFLWRLPQKHLAGSAVGVLVESVHLEIMLVGCGSLWLDVGPARQTKTKQNNAFLYLNDFIFYKGKGKLSKK